MNMFKPSGVKTPQEYINLIAEPRRSEVRKIDEFIRKTAPSLKPYMEYGIIGYGKFPYKSKSGREGTWFALGLASQKNYISIYSCAVKDGQYLAEKYKGILGKASVGKSCIRYKKIEDIPWENLARVLKESEDLVTKEGIFSSGENT
jgi:hypothetical protein